METTFTSMLKHNALPVAALSVVIYLQTGTSGDIQNLRDDIQTLRTEMSEGHQAIRAEMGKGDQAIRAEMGKGDQAIRAEMNAGFQAIRAEMNAGFQAIRAEMAESDQAIRADISVLGERMARVETRLDSIEDRLYTDTSRPTM